MNERVASLCFDSICNSKAKHLDGGYCAYCVCVCVDIFMIVHICFGACMHFQWLGMETLACAAGGVWATFPAV